MTFAQVCGVNIVLWLIVILIYNLDGITMASILNNIQDGKDITSGLTNNSSKKISKFTAAKEYLGMLAAADNPTPAGRAASDRKSTRLNSSHSGESRMPSSA